MGCSKYSVVRWLLLWLALLACAGLCYAPGLHGGFLFDDFANLAPLGKSDGGVHNFDTLRAYLQSGFAGPTGRPISLLSFLLDARDWPADPFSFKRTNLILHALCATMILACSVVMLRALSWPENRVWPVALLGATLWLLHPLWISTTLYAVQRMAQLAALFVLLGLWAWLHGRQYLPSSPRRAYVWMSLAVLFGTVLAVLSKENGILLPVLIGVVEWVLASQHEVTHAARPSLFWRAIFLYLPSILVIGYLLSLVDFSEDAWPHRDFTQPQRLWTESRILWGYLGLLWLPRVEAWGLFQDAYPLSTGWLEPVSTLMAAIGLIGVVALGVFVRKKYPLWSVGLLFFLAGHLLESTTVGLELYFEHRNYLPAAFMFLPLGQALFGLYERNAGYLAAAPGLVIFIILCSLLYARAALWSDVEHLQLHWALRQPQSARAQEALISYLLAHGEATQARRVLEDALQQKPQSSLLHIRRLLMAISENRASAGDFEQAAQVFSKARMDAQLANGITILVDAVRQAPVESSQIVGMQKVLTGLQENPGYQRSEIARYANFQKGLLELSLGRFEQANNYMERAMQEAAHPDLVLRILRELVEFGQYAKALELMPLAKMVMKRIPETQLEYDRTTYQNELEHIDQHIRLNSNRGV
ncbi:hypothetical protein ABFV80_002465 [Vandammella animalimorsus]|uniref:hypothetical protein n=1 Tax=Vandammella animalimorsus TaxID=2029117 RepID=UPI00325BD299